MSSSEKIRHLKCAAGSRIPVAVALLAAAMLAGPVPAAGQEAAEAAGADAAGAAEEDSAGTGTDEAAETASAPSAEVFIPTEEISEDFAVSFPVDI